MTRQDGFTLLELMIALGLGLIVAAAVATLVAGTARVSLALARETDEQQRLRAGVDQLTQLIAAAGSGLAGAARNEGSLLVPVLYPQRRGVAVTDADTAAHEDRLTIFTGADPPASARLGADASTTAAPLVLDVTSCAPGRSACGFVAGGRVLIADAAASGELITVLRTAGGLVEHAEVPSRTYALGDDPAITLAEATAVAFDARRRQLRVLTAGGNQPFIDGVAAFEVRWLADPRAPAGPLRRPGESNCVTDAAGTPRLATLAPNDGPWTELSMAQLSDGPWCGSAPWRFDADLFRVRIVRITLRLASSRPDGDPFAARFSSGEVVFDVAPPNLVRMR